MVEWQFAFTKAYCCRIPTAGLPSRRLLQNNQVSEVTKQKKSVGYHAHS